MEQKHVGGRQLYARRRRAAARLPATTAGGPVRPYRTWWRILPRLVRR